MRTAIDTSVLLSIFNEESDASDWVELLIQARREGQLVVCAVVFSELAPGFTSQKELENALARLGVVYDSISPPAAYLAGRTFAKYRADGGPREHMIPDFLIAAHALAQTGRLAAADRGYVRVYFRQLTVLTP